MDEAGCADEREASPAEVIRARPHHLRPQLDRRNRLASSYAQMAHVVEEGGGLRGRLRYRPRLGAREHLEPLCDQLDAPGGPPVLPDGPGHLHDRLPRHIPNGLEHVLSGYPFLGGALQIPRAISQYHEDYPADPGLTRDPAVDGRLRDATLGENLLDRRRRAPNPV